MTTHQMTDGERLVKVETQIDDLHNDVHDANVNLVGLGMKLDGLNDRLNGRPSWSVVGALMFLSSLCVGLATALAARI